MPTSSDLAALAALTHRLADAAGAVALRHFRTEALTADDKGGGLRFDPVTVADRAAETAIRTILELERPEDGILGEEHDPVESRSGLTWVIDPIDGTRAYISGLPTWGVLIGLDDGRQGRIGLIEQPHIGERFIGINHEGRSEALYHHSGRSRTIATRRCKALEGATLFTTAPEIFTEIERARFEAVRARARLTRYGVDCYAYAMVAMGQVDLVIESALQAYDIAAPAALIRAAGGVVTDWQGGDCRWGGQVLASGDAALHDQVLQILNG